MNWYYAEAGKQAGPITEEELLRLADSGRIQADTLVWHEGLANWQVYGYVKPTPAGRPPVLPRAQPHVISPRSAATRNQILSCPKCRAPVPAFFLNRGEPAPCPGCNALLQVEVFPAFFRQIAEGKPGETILVEGEASCFYHPQKRAILPCAACGRFLCALCDVELNNEHLCPGCLETGRKKGKLTHLETKRTLYDSSALLLAVFPMIIFCTWWLSVVTAPAAIILAVYSWYQPASILPRTRIRSYLAILIGLAQIAVWVLFLAGVWNFRSLP